MDTNNEVVDLLQQVKILLTEITQCHKIIESNKKKIDDLEKEIMKKCNHNWVVDRTNCDPHGRTQYYCTVCNLCD